MADRFDYDNLIAGSAHALTAQTVVVASGEGQLKKGSLLMRNSGGKYILADATVVGADNPSTKPWHEKNGSKYEPSEDTVAFKTKTYYSVEAEAASPGGSEVPSTEGWYERSGSSPYTYTLTTDDTVDAEKTYYVVTATEAEPDYGTATAKGDAEVILAADVDATSADAVAEAYNSGEFFTESLICAEGYVITDADRLNLKNAGIYLVSGLK